jgi:hypothetical protein
MERRRGQLISHRWPAWQMIGQYPRQLHDPRSPNQIILWLHSSDFRFPVGYSSLQSSVASAEFELFRLLMRRK